jgi:hypothetical protein
MPLAPSDLWCIPFTPPAHLGQVAEARITALLYAAFGIIFRPSYVIGVANSSYDPRATRYLICLTRGHLTGPKSGRQTLHMHTKALASPDRNKTSQPGA